MVAGELQHDTEKQQAGVQYQLSSDRRWFTEAWHVRLLLFYKVSLCDIWFGVARLWVEIADGHIKRAKLNLKPPRIAALPP